METIIDGFCNKCINSDWFTAFARNNGPARNILIEIDFHGRPDLGNWSLDPPREIYALVTNNP